MLDRQTGFQLSFRPPLDWTTLSNYLAARAIPGIEVVRDGYYLRSAWLGEGDGRVEGWLQLSCPVEGSHVQLLLSSSLADHHLQVAQRVRKLLDLDHEPGISKRLLSADPILGKPTVHNPGIRVLGAWDAFETATRIILGQHVSVKAANRVCQRLVEKYGHSLTSAAPAGITHRFPVASELAEASIQNVGLTRARANAVQALARATITHPELLEGRMPLNDSYEKLLCLPGIGPWTAALIALRVLGDKDAFPAGDLGLRRAMARLVGRRVTEPELETLSDSWRPWRGYAAMLLWTIR